MAVVTVAVERALQHIDVLRKIVGELRAMEVTHAPRGILGGTLSTHSGELSTLTLGELRATEATRPPTPNQTLFLGLAFEPLSQMGSQSAAAVAAWHAGVLL